MIVLKVKNNFFLKTVKETIKTIRNGGVVVCPTDTVYGILCDSTNREAVSRLFEIKKRPKNKPVPIFVKNLKAAKELVTINKSQEEFLKKVWPGKTTVVLKLKTQAKKTGRKLKLYGTDKKTIALRIPNYQLVNILLEKTNLPLVGTSANISGKPATTRIKEVLKQLNSCPHLILDAGNLKASKPSTIIDLTGPEPKVLRK